LQPYPHFVTRILTASSIHFIHVRSARGRALPLIVTHGGRARPSSSSRSSEPLTDPTAHGAGAADAFHP
jgi:hypothetical protein